LVVFPFDPADFFAGFLQILFDAFFFFAQRFLIWAFVSLVRCL